MLHAFLQAVNPGKITNVTDVLTKVLAWEQILARLKSEYNEELSGGMKMALFVSMLPKRLMEMVMQNSAMTETEAPYERVRTQVLTVAKQKASLRNPQPMDVDQVGGDGDLEVDAVRRPGPKRAAAPPRGPTELLG